MSLATVLPAARISLRLSAVLLLGCLSSVTARAGVIYHVECVDPAGTVARHSVSIGGGFFFQQVTGYCESRQAYVRQTWDGSAASPEPPTLADGRIKVEDCEEPIHPIQSKAGLTRCPGGIGTVRSIRRASTYD